jgi:hypothetical protein
MARRVSIGSHLLRVTPFMASFQKCAPGDEIQSYTFVMQIF